MASGPLVAPESVAVTAQEPRSTVGRVSGSEGVSIAYEVRGEGGPTLVFVHGWSCDRSYWAPQLEAFAQEFRVVAVDLGGHGESGLGRQAWTIESFGEDVAAVVEALGLQRVILIGHSMGGDVVPEAARRLTGRVAGLIWVDAYKQLGSGRTPEQVQAFVARFRPNFAATTKVFVRGMFLPTSDQALVDRVATDMAAAPPTVALPALESTFGYSREVVNTLSALKLPVIAINPDNEPTDVASMNRHGVEVLIMPGVGHFLHLENAETFNRLLRRAIDKIQP
jgi:pimeloyl-ACP methyl ester carboxylesterase